MIIERGHLGGSGTFDLAWAEANNQTITDAMFGVVANGVVDDAAAENAFLAHIAANPTGHYRMIPGPRLFGSQVTLDRTGGQAEDSIPITIDAYGTLIHTSGAISAFKLLGGSQTAIRGMTIKDTNAAATAGFEQCNAHHVKWVDCINYSLGENVGGAYKPWWMHQANPVDPNTGCFWSTFYACTIRCGLSAYLPHGIYMQGACNATNFYGLSVSGCYYGLEIRNEAGLEYLANGVELFGPQFEGITTDAICVAGNPGGQQTTEGFRLIGGRFENVGRSILRLEGCTANAYRVPLLLYPEMQADVSAYISNPNNLAVSAYSSNIGRDDSPNITVCRSGLRIMAIAGTPGTDAFNVSTGDYNGIRISSLTAPDTALAWWRWVASGAVELAGNQAAGYGMFLTSISAISGNTTRRRNLRGSLILDGSGQGTVTFPVAEPDANYFPFLSVANAAVPAEGVSWAGLTVNGFSVYGPVNAQVYWMILG